MARTLTEEQVLKKLKIQDFRHMTKDKIVAFTSMLSKMDPEIAKKALEQFPEFAKRALEIVQSLETALEKVMVHNEKSIQNYYDACNQILVTLKEDIQKDGITDEQKQYDIEKMIVVADMMGNKDTENREFILEGFKNFCKPVLGIAVALASFLGVVTVIKDSTGEDDLV